MSCSIPNVIVVFVENVSLVQKLAKETLRGVGRQIGRARRAVTRENGVPREAAMRATGSLVVGVGGGDFDVGERVRVEPVIQMAEVLVAIERRDRVRHSNRMMGEVDRGFVVRLIGRRRTLTVADRGAAAGDHPFGFHGEMTIGDDRWRHGYEQLLFARGTLPLSS